MGLNLRQIEAFRAVMVTGAVTEAAEMMFITQPAVSRLISDFEYAVGFKLFDRSRRKLVPTQEGLALYAEVDRTFAGLGHIQSTADAIRNMQIGHLSIVAMPIASTGFLSEAIANFNKEYNDISVSLWTWPRDQALKWIVSQQYDLGVITLPVSDPTIRVDAFPDLDTVCLLPKGHKLCQKSVIYAEDFNGESFISLTAGSRFRYSVEQIFADHKVNPISRIEARSAEAICSLVERGVGISVLGRLAVYGRSGDSLVIKPFRPSIPFKAGLVYPSQRPISSIARKFAAHVTAVAVALADDI